MQNRSRRLVVSVLFSTLAFTGPGCHQPSERLALPEVHRVARVARTAAERRTVIRPGKFGANGAADVRRGFFDFWNEQIIREDKEVGTVFMGDSITELWNLHVYFSPALGEIIENRGISSDLASVMVKRFEADVIQLRPRNVVILAGTNDVADMIRADKPDDEIINAVTASIEAMMDAALAADIKVFVCSILPTNEDYRLHGQRTYLRARINERLKAACQAKGCIYVDYASAVQDAKGALRKDLARDGLHPHSVGYKIMARVLLDTAKAHGIRL
ncbi:MAG: G-D-S-L family lipolytic protein [Phycisphaerae bacterium]|nr:G-D-S-L family lipolytic protein [Phycisphaerae bacterium]